MGDWLATVRTRLTSAGFVLSDDVAFGGRTFPLVARRTRFELTKFGFSESFFVFEEFDRLTAEELRAFSTTSFRCAKKRSVIPLPCGLFESVWCYAVAIAGSVDESILAAVRSETPPRHWAAAEIPVVYDAGRHRLCYFEKTPVWGAAYYKGFRKQIERTLGDDAQA